MSIAEQFELLSEDNKTSVERVVAVLVDLQNERITTRDALFALSTLPTIAKDMISEYLTS